MALRYYSLSGDFASLNNPALQKPDTLDFVYNPFYRQNIHKYSDENCGSGRISLMRIFERDEVEYSIAKLFCDVLPLHDINWVIGPVSYTEIKLPNSSKNIGIFGEIHKINQAGMHKQDTVTMASFLLSLGIAFKDRRYDILVEIDYEDGNTPREIIGGGSPTLRSLYTYFKNCMSDSREGCEYNNLNFHTIDYRNATKHRFPIIRERTPDEDIIKMLGGKTIQQYAEYEVKNIIAYMNEDKNVSTSPYIKDILDYSEKILVRYYLDTNIDTIAKLRDFLVYAYAEIVNIYTISRIFREDTGDNIILYVGDAHAVRIKDFLMTYMNGVMTQHIVYKNTRNYALLDRPNFIPVYPLKTKSFLFV